MIRFNHISKALTSDKIKEFSDLFAYYHKLAYCYKSKYKSLKRLSLALHMFSISLTATGAVVGAVTLNPIILGVFTGSGVLLQGYITKVGLSEKIQQCKFAYTSYDKTLVQLRSNLRGMPFDEVVFLSDMTVIENIVTDSCPPIEREMKRYDKKFKKNYYPV